MTQNERSRALFVEVWNWMNNDTCRDCEYGGRELRKRIDAALAEPVEAEETEHAMHMRIRAGYDRVIADSWRAKVAEVERERDEARAEVERLKAQVEWLQASNEAARERADRGETGS
jgi:hypothetical protein